MPDTGLHKTHSPSRYLFTTCLGSLPQGGTPIDALFPPTLTQVSAEYKESYAQIVSPNSTLAPVYIAASRLLSPDKDIVG